MATTTTNLGMTLPDYTDARDIAVLNGNFELIDAGTVMKNQGSANAGKLLVVGNNGAVSAEPYIVVERKMSGIFEIPASDDDYVINIDVAKTGYTPVGIVGVTCNYCKVNQFVIVIGQGQGSGQEARLRLTNPLSLTVNTMAAADVLYIKDVTA